VRIARRILIGLLIAGLVGAAVGYHKLLRFKRFGVVADGILYRSGMLHDWQWRWVLQRHRIRTVFSLTHTRWSEIEQICADANVRRYFAYLPGDGAGTDDPYLRFLEVVSDPANQPVLVHCSAGVQRTGGAVALFRMLRQGWSFDDAIAEMIAYGNDGNRPQIDQLRRIYDTYCREKGTGPICAKRPKDHSVKSDPSPFPAQRR
jgi:protein tyrosine/serine phosphatase